LSRHCAARTGRKARQCRSVPAFFEARFTRLSRVRARAFLSNEEHALFFRLFRGASAATTRADTPAARPLKIESCDPNGTDLCCLSHHREAAPPADLLQPKLVIRFIAG